jgi:hypothetical protein
VLVEVQLISEICIINQSNKQKRDLQNKIFHGKEFSKIIDLEIIFIYSVISLQTLLKEQC